MVTTETARRVLIVEGDRDLNLLLTDLLHDAGYEAESAFSLEEALHKTNEQLYDLVLTDHLTEGPPAPGHRASLRLVRSLRQAYHPTPVGLLTTWPIDLSEAERDGFAFALRKPFDIDVVMQRVAACLNIALTPEQQQQEQHLRRLLQAVSQDDEATLRALCAPTVAYYPLTGSILTSERAILGIERYLSHVHQMHQRLKQCRIEHVHIFTQRGRLIARHLCSWQGLPGQRHRMSGSVQCRFRGEHITHIGEALPTRRLRELLGEA